MIKNIFIRLSEIILPIVLITVPKNNKILLFSEWSGIPRNDNAETLFKYAKANLSNSKSYFIVSLKENSNIEKGYIYKYSFFSIWLHIRAKYFFLTHNIGADFIRSIVSKNSKRINLWHGLPIKKIRFDDTKTYSKLNIYIKSSKVYQFLSNERYDYISSVSESSSILLAKALGHRSKNMLGIGFPRNDLIDKNQKNPKSKNLLYAPTFRNDVGSKISIKKELKIDLKEMNDFLNDQGQKLYIKLHPANILDEIEEKKICKLENIILTNESNLSLYNKIICLITDYSSSIYDFARTGKNIIFYCPDFDDYQENSRDFYINPSEMKNGIFCENYKSLCSSIKNIKSISRYPDFIYANADYNENICKNILSTITR